MPKASKPRAGSMQYWPRKRAKRIYTRIRAWPKINDVKLLGFAGYKVGMTHILFTDNQKTSLTKGEDIFCPVTIIECPPLKTSSLRFYKKTKNGLKLVSEIFAEKLDKELGRRIKLPKKINQKVEDIKDFDDIRLGVYTQPRLTGIGKKKPEIFEIAIGGVNKEEKLNYAKEKLGKEINIKDVFNEGEQIDIHAVTKGKGYEGPVKRFRIGLRSHKSEKTIRGPGSLGPWTSQTHIMYRIAHAGQHGYHTRTEYNKWILRIDDKIDNINQKGGFLHYGVLKNPYMIVKGSIPGHAKRLIRFNYAIRANKKIINEPPSITYINLNLDKK
jgi:large subunit ribosomal protein L3